MSESNEIAAALLKVTQVEESVVEMVTNGDIPLSYLKELYTKNLDPWTHLQILESNLNFLIAEVIKERTQAQRGSYFYWKHRLDKFISTYVYRIEDSKKLLQKMLSLIESVKPEGDMPALIANVLYLSNSHWITRSFQVDRALNKEEKEFLIANYDLISSVFACFEYLPNNGLTREEYRSLIEPYVALDEAVRNGGIRL